MSSSTRLGRPGLGGCFDICAGTLAPGPSGRLVRGCALALGAMNSFAE